jgi:transcriptional regulator with XRE-family HTH domain
MGSSADSWHTAERERAALSAALHASAAVPEDWVAMPVGRIVRRLRKQLGLEQWSLGRRVGMRQSMVSRIERGADLRVSTLRKLLAAMGCELVVLPRSDRSLERLGDESRAHERQEAERGRRALREALQDLKE